ncbi:MAG TPA: hypothetical protein VGI54_08380 [Solirubrobacteraceae bacterium]
MLVTVVPTLPLAHHIVQALPFFAPVLVIVGGLGALIAVDRLRGDDEPDDS